MVPFKFNNAQIFTVTIDNKIWIRAKEVVKKSLAFKKDTSDTIRKHCSRENCAQKYQLIGSPGAREPTNWPIDSQKYDYYINEEEMNELVFGSQQPEDKSL